MTSSGWCWARIWMANFLSSLMWPRPPTGASAALAFALALLVATPVALGAALAAAEEGALACLAGFLPKDGCKPARTAQSGTQVNGKRAEARQAHETILNTRQHLPKCTWVERMHATVMAAV